jgi:hypothetical protein
MHLTWSYVEAGGYDCMTDALYVVDLERKNPQIPIAVMDLANYGQENNEPAHQDSVRAAERYVKMFVHAPAMCQLLKDLQPDATPERAAEIQRLVDAVRVP